MSAAARPPKLSIIVNSYNYGRYLKDSIGSALAVRWPNKEVLVVDDGSTDDSRAVITSYGEQVIPLFKENGGLNSAANLAFARSSGDVVIFLDADDMLFEGAAQAVMERWHEGVSAVQFGHEKIDERGQRIGTPWPVYNERNTPEWVRRTVLRTGYYEGPPTSGSAWSRRFLEQVFPLPTRQPGQRGRWGLWFDDYLNTLAPFFGDVILLTSPQGNYRIHGQNAHGGRGFSPEYEAELCTYETARMRAVNEVLARRPGGHRVDVELLTEHMRHRMVFKRWLPERYDYGDSMAALFVKLCRATWRSEMGARGKMMMVLWALLVAFSPDPLAFRAAQLKQDIEARPKILRLIWKW